MYRRCWNPSLKGKPWILEIKLTHKNTYFPFTLSLLSFLQSHVTHLPVCYGESTLSIRLSSEGSSLPYVHELLSARYYPTTISTIHSLPLGFLWVNIVHWRMFCSHFINFILLVHNPSLRLLGPCLLTLFYLDNKIPFLPPPLFFI